MSVVGTFTRVAPADFAEKVGIPLGWFVISFRYMPEKWERRLQHGKWFKLSTREGSVYRILRFSERLEGGPGEKGQIVIDYPGWLELLGYAENTKVQAKISIARARWWEICRLAVAHPDPSVRLAGQIALLSFVLGVVSLVLGVLPLLKG